MSQTYPNFTFPGPDGRPVSRRLDVHRNGGITTAILTQCWTDTDATVQEVATHAWPAVTDLLGKAPTLRIVRHLPEGGSSTYDLVALVDGQARLARMDRTSLMAAVA